MNTLTPDESRRAANAVYEAGREIVRLREQLATTQFALEDCARERDAALARADHAERNLAAGDVLAEMGAQPAPDARTVRLVEAAREYALASGAVIGAPMDDGAAYTALVRAERELHAAALPFGDAAQDAPDRGAS